MPPAYPTVVRTTPGRQQKTASASQNHPRPEVRKVRGKVELMDNISPHELPFTIWKNIQFELATDQVWLSVCPPLASPPSSPADPGQARQAGRGPAGTTRSYRAKPQDL